MNGKDYIMLKQRRWAKRNGLGLLPGAVGRDDIEKNYLSDVALNLFEPLSEASLASFEKGDGNEMKDGEKRLAKIKAIHSSAAIAVNLFQYWCNGGAYSVFVACPVACGALA